MVVRRRGLFGRVLPGTVGGAQHREVPTDGIAAMYRHFATVEAAGRSPVYAEITDRISRDALTLTFLAALPPQKRQPNLLLAAVQYLRGPLTGWAAFADALAEPGDVAHVIRTRSTPVSYTHLTLPTN